MSKFYLVKKADNNLKYKECNFDIKQIQTLMQIKEQAGGPETSYAALPKDTTLIIKLK